MRLNTLTFDANLPTTQQVNVPTNTDYKVGMKVKRNGEVQQLGPDEFTIYTGEINVIPPTEYDSAAKNCSESIETILYNLDTTTATELSGQTVKATGVYIEISEDNGSTWQKKDPSGNVNLRVSDRSTGSNVYLYRTNLKNADRVWEVFDTDGTTVIGTTDTITVPQIGRFGTGSMLPTLFGDFTYPIKYRLVVNYGGGVEQITIPTDADKTNGYVTFTQAAGDDASFRQLKVAIEHGYNFNDYTERLTGQFGSTTPDPNPSILKVKASDLGLIGYTVKAEEYKNVHSYSWRKSTPQPADLSAWSYKEYIWPQTVPYPPEQPWPQFKFTQWDGRDVYIGCPVNDVTFNNENDDPGIKGRTAKKGVYYFFITNEEGTKFVDFYTERTLKADDYVIVGNGLRYTANYYYGRCYKMTFGAPFNSNFKLNVNEFKSQCGDLNVQTDPEFSTAKVEGTYADGTEFSFDFCIQ